MSNCAITHAFSRSSTETISPTVTDFPAAAGTTTPSTGLSSPTEGAADGGAFHTGIVSGK